MGSVTVNWMSAWRRVCGLHRNVMTRSLFTYRAGNGMTACQATPGDYDNVMTRSLFTYRAENGMTACQATPGDYEDVMTLSKTVFGKDFKTDYLPGRYTKFLRNPNKICYMITDDKHAVGFVIQYVVDGGRTVLGLGARMLPHLRAAGVLKELAFKTMLKEFLPRWPEICRVRGTTTNVSHYEVDLRHKTDILAKRLLVRVHLGAGERRITRSDDVMTAAHADICDVIRNGAHVTELFPDNIIFSNVDAYEVMTDNVDELFYYNDNNYLTRDTDGHVTSLSLGNLLPCNDNKSNRYTLNYYGRVDLGMLASHIQTHYRALHPAVALADVYFVVCVPLGFEQVFGQQRIGDVLKRTLLCPDTTVADYFQQCVFQHNDYNDVGQKFRNTRV